MNEREDQQRTDDPDVTHHDDPEAKTGYGRPYENDREATFVAGEHGTTHVASEPGDVLDDETDEEHETDMMHETTVQAVPVQAVPEQDEYAKNDYADNEYTKDEHADDVPDADLQGETFQEEDRHTGPLFDQDPAQLQERWRDLQWAFVDDPRQTVERAGGLVEEVVTTLTTTLTTRTSELRDRWKNTAENDTEQLRLALREYRDVLERLLTLSGGKES